MFGILSKDFSPCVPSLLTISYMLPSNFPGPRSAAWLESHPICKWQCQCGCSRGNQMFVTHINVQVCIPWKPRSDAKLRVFGWFAIRLHKTLICWDEILLVCWFFLKEKCQKFELFLLPWNWF